MTASTIAPLRHPERPDRSAETVPAEQRFFLSNVSWASYLAIADAIGERQVEKKTGPRFRP